MSSDLLTRVESPTAESGSRRQFSAWVWDNRTDIAVVVVLLATLGVVHATGMYSFPARFDDEGAYMSQAWAVITRFDLSHYTYWYDHPPLGWLVLAVYLALTGSLARAPYGVAAGREAMLLFHLAGAALLYVLARRLGLRRIFAAIVVVIYGLSPLGIFFHRMVLLDNLAMPFLLAGFVLILSPQKKLGAHVAAAASLAIAVLIREIFVIFIPLAVWLYWRSTSHENRRYSLALVGSTFVGLVGLYPTFALLRGELFPGPERVSLLGAVAWQLFDRQGSGSVFDSSTPAGKVLASWVTLDPWILVLGVLFAAVALFSRRLRWVGLVVVIFAVMLLRPGYLPVMYVLPVLPFLALSIGGLLDEAWESASQRMDSRRSTEAMWVRRGLVGAGLAALVFVVGPFYHVGIDRAMAADSDRPFEQTQAWLEANLAEDDVIMLDGALWLDVVRSGHPAENAVWFYKLDSDPGVDVQGGWRGVDYIVSSEVVRNSVYNLPEMEEALNHSETIVTFGKGEGRIEIRRVES